MRNLFICGPYNGAYRWGEKSPYYKAFIVQECTYLYRKVCPGVYVLCDEDETYTFFRGL